MPNEEKADNKTTDTARRKRAEKKKKATARDLIKSRENYVVEVTLKRGDDEFVLPLQPLDRAEHDAIFGQKGPRRPTMLLPKIKDGSVAEGEDKVWRYMEEIDFAHPKLDEYAPGARKQWEEYETKLTAHNKAINYAMIFAVLPDEMKAEFDEEYKARSPENIEKFLDRVFMVGELTSLIQEIYPRVVNALGLEYGPFSGLDFLKNLEIGNLPNLG